MCWHCNHLWDVNNKQTNKQTVSLQNHVSTNFDGNLIRSTLTLLSTLRPQYSICVQYMNKYCVLYNLYTLYLCKSIWTTAHEFLYIQYCGVYRVLLHSSLSTACCIKSVMSGCGSLTARVSFEFHTCSGETETPPPHDDDDVQVQSELKHWQRVLMKDQVHHGDSSSHWGHCRSSSFTWLRAWCTWQSTLREQRRLVCLCGPNSSLKSADFTAAQFSLKAKLNLKENKLNT